MDDFIKLLDGFMQISKNMEATSGRQMIVDERNELKCIKLYGEGWNQDGFDFVPNSRDIITYWKKEGESERKEVRLTADQQRRWIRILEANGKRVK